MYVELMPLVSLKEYNDLGYTTVFDKDSVTYRSR